MSFFGKKFKRVRSENLEQMVEALNMPDKAGFLMRSQATFGFNRVDDSTYTFELITGDRTITTKFKLGEETEVERRDGSKARVTYLLESDNVMSQTIKPPVGNFSYFRREFTDNACVMTIRVEGCDIEAKLFYELVE